MRRFTHWNYWISPNKVPFFYSTLLLVNFTSTLFPLFSPLWLFLLFLKTPLFCSKIHSLSAKICCWLASRFLLFIAEVLSFITILHLWSIVHLSLYCSSSCRAVISVSSSSLQCRTSRSATLFLYLPSLDLRAMLPIHHHPIVHTSPVLCKETVKKRYKINLNFKQNQNMDL